MPTLLAVLPLLLGAPGNPESAARALAPAQAAIAAPCPYLPWADLKKARPAEPVQYPILAQMQHISGDVTVQFRVSPQGNVHSAKALDGPPILHASAEQFVQSLWFHPPLLNGRAAEVQSRIQIRFKPTWDEGDPAPKPLTGYVLHLTTTATGKAPKLDQLALKKRAREWLAKMNLKPIDGTPTDPAGTLDLSLHVTTWESGPEVILQHTTLRVSTWADRNVDPAKAEVPRKAWSILKVAGQRNPEGYATSLGRILENFTQDLGILNPGTPGPGEPSASTGQDPARGSRQIPDQDFSPLKVRHTPPPPPYPVPARKAKIQGTVVVELTIDPKGLPIEAVAVSGPEALVGAAISHALQWRFEPPTLNGSPHFSRFRLTMPFRLR